MKKESIVSAIKDEVSNWENSIIKSNPPFARTMPNLYDLIDLYMLSQYRDDNTDSFGQPKVFYNVVGFPVEVASKMIDLDTKNILFMAEDENFDTTWLMEKEFKFWMKDKYFGRELNRYSYYLPRDGHLVVKKVDDEVKIVPIKNLRFRPDAVSLKNTPLVEVFKYQPDEFLAEAKKRGWENYEGLTDKKSSSNSYDTENKIIVYGAYFPEGFLESKYNYFLICGGEILSYLKMDKSPFKDVSWEEVQNRAVGRGQVEKLMPEQIYLNRTANAKAEALYWLSKILFQSRDPSIGTNLLIQTENGDVLTPTSEITQIAIQERNLGIYSYDESRWEKQAIKRAFMSEPITGERAPSGTPLGSTMLQAQMTGQYYKQKKENLGEFIKEIIWDWILPEFKNQNRKEHKILIKNLLTDDVASENFFQMKLNDRMNKLKSQGKYLTSDQWKIRRTINAQMIKNSSLKVPKGTYDNAKFKMNIVITGEEIDIASRLTTLQTIFQIIGSNPAILQDKKARRILYKMADLSGINPRELGLEDPMEDLSQQLGEIRAQRGGSIASPTTPSLQPTMMPAQATV